MRRSYASRMHFASAWKSARISGYRRGGLPQRSLPQGRRIAARPAFVEFMIACMQYTSTTFSRSGTLATYHTRVHPHVPVQVWYKYGELNVTLLLEFYYVVHLVVHDPNDELDLKANLLE